MRVTDLTDIPHIKKSGKLSPEFLYIIEHFPDDVLDILKHSWATYKTEVDEAIRHTIANHSVQCSDGHNVSRQPLKDTYVPEPTLKRISSELCNDGRTIPFLVLEPYTLSGWNFLTKFDVGITADLDFYFWVGKQPQFREGCTLPIAKKFLKRVAELTGFDANKTTRV
jgi:hypothetical protein